MKKLNLFQISLIFITIVLCCCVTYQMIAVSKFSVNDTNSMVGVVVGSILYSAIFIALAVPLILKNSDRHTEKRVFHQATHKNIHFYLFFACLVLSLFKIFKVFYYASHRELESYDYNIVSGDIIFSALIMFWMLYIHTYNKSGNLRKSTFTLTLIISVLLCISVYSSLNTFLSLFFATDIYTPLFIDKFTSLFELIYTILFTCLFIFYFIYLIIKKYFHKQKIVE